MRTFTLVEGTSDKFWHIDVAEAEVTVHYGRSGTKGQTKTTAYADAAEAATQAQKQIAAKVKKGYVEGAAGGALAPAAPAASAAPAAAPAPAPTPSSAPESDAAPAPESAPASAPAASPAPAAGRPVEPDADWGDDGLGLIRPQMVAAAFPGGPAPSTEPAADQPAYSPADEGAWLKTHGIRTDDWWPHFFFAVPRVDGRPTTERAGFWNRWAVEGLETTKWGTVQPLSNPKRTSIAKAAAKEGPGSLTEPLGRCEDGDPWLLLASRLVLTDPAQTLTTATMAGHPQLLAPTYVAPLRAFVLRLLDEAALAPWREEPPTVGAPFPHHSDPGEHQDVLRSALVNTPERHLELLRSLPRPGYILEAALYAVEDRAVRAELLLGQDDRPRSVESVRNWLWLIGVDALEPIVEGIRHDGIDKATALGLIRALGELVHGPAAVPTMVALAQDPRVGVPARAWLVGHPRALAADDSSVTPAQREILLSVVRETLALDPDAYPEPITNPVVAAAIDDVRAEAALPVYGDAAPMPPWWDDAVRAEAEAPVAEGKLKIPAKLPAYATAQMLGSKAMAGARLTDAMVEAIVASALHGANEPALTPRPLVAAAREQMSARERDALGLALLDGFLAAGAKSPERPVFVAAGYLGADRFAQKLTPLVREWPGQSQHQRAVLGLDVLAATGTSTALQAISGIANKSKFKGVQAAAQESLAKLAALQGLSVEQLEDRVVPDAGLDARGQRVLDFGPRQFRVTLSPQGKAVIRDLDVDGRPTGKPRTTLPAPNSKDDADLAAAAKADFSVLRKQLTELAKIQTARLERAMVTARTWSAAEHAEFVVAHPILNALIQPLVWSVERDGGRLALVRATDEHDYVTVDEAAYVVADDATLTLAHPVGISAEENAAWRQHLLDYDLIAPVEQLDRAVFGFDPAQQPGLDLAGMPTGTINPGALSSTLERLGWRRGNPADAGVIHFLSLTFPSHDVAVVIGIEPGLWAGMIYDSGDQRLDQLRLGPAAQPEQMWYLNDRGQVWHDWATAHPIVVSETHRSLAALAEKMT